MLECIISNVVGGVISSGVSVVTSIRMHNKKLKVDNRVGTDGHSPYVKVIALPFSKSRINNIDQSIRGTSKLTTGGDDSNHTLTKQ